MNRNAAFWPSPAQETLLRAALLGLASDAAAWRTLAQDTPRGPMDRDDQTLLALLHGRVPAGPALAPLEAIARNAYRRTWMEHNLVVRSAQRVVHALAERGIRCILLKGLAVGLRYYPEPARRAMGDLDILVDPAEAAYALDVLGRLGYAACPPHSDPRRLLRWSHAVNLVDSSGSNVDLHWRLMLEAGPPSFQREQRDRVLPLQVGAEQAFVLHPADQLLHLLVHGARSEAGSKARWVPDALHLLRTTGATFDWALLVEGARRSRNCLPTFETLRYLASTFQVSVPGEVLEALRLGITARERLEFLSKTGRDASREPLRASLALWLRYGRAQESAPEAGGREGVRQFLRDVWDLEARDSVVREALQRWRRRVR